MPLAWRPLLLPQQLPLTMVRLLARLPKSHARRQPRGHADQLINWLADQLRLETGRPSQIYAQLPYPPRGRARPR